MAAFTHYWQNDTWLAQGERDVSFAASNSFRARGVSAGDRLYMISVFGGKLFVGARIDVRKVVGRRQAEQILDQTDLWVASDYAIAERAVAFQPNLVVPDDTTSRLRFVPDKRPVFTAPGVLDQQTLRGVRELTAASAALLDRVLGTTPIDGTSGWDDELHREFRAYIQDGEPRATFDEMVRIGRALPQFDFRAARHGNIRDMRYFDRGSNTQPFAFIVNQGDLLFYIRQRGLERIEGGFEALKRTFPSALENPSGEWKIRVASVDEARRLSAFVFGSDALDAPVMRSLSRLARSDILDAIRRFQRGERGDFGDSTGYNLAFEEATYPPKAIVGLAAKAVLGRILKPNEFSSGERIFDLLDRLGFDVVDKGGVRVDEVQAELEEQRLRATADIPPTEKAQLINARRGQGAFRANVFKVEPRCRITGVADGAHLRASHIKPWAKSTNAERLDGNNGLVLAPHIDHLFDRGYISFTDTGDLLVSEQCPSSVLSAWGVLPDTNVGHFRPPQRQYLAYHRSHRFKG